MRGGRSLALFLAVAGAVAAVLGAVALASGTSEPPEPTETPVAPDGVTATVEQTTAFQARGLLEIAISNRSGAEFAIGSLRLVSGSFVTVEPTPRDAVIPSGPRRVIVPVDYGPPRCTAGTAPPDAVEVSTPGGGELRLVPVDRDGSQFLARLHERECGQRRIRETVDISFDGPFTDAGPASVRAAVRLRRLDAADGTEVTVAAVRGTVVFTVTTSADAPLLVLGDGDDEASVEIDISASRCDAHALIESKKSYRFPFWVAVGDAQPRYIEVEPEGEARRVLERVLQEGCFGS